MKEQKANKKGDDAIFYRKRDESSQGFTLIEVRRRPRRKQEVSQ